MGALVVTVTVKSPREMLRNCRVIFVKSPCCVVAWRIRRCKMLFFLQSSCDFPSSSYSTTVQVECIDASSNAESSAVDETLYDASIAHDHDVSCGVMLRHPIRRRRGTLGRSDVS